MATRIINPKTMDQITCTTRSGTNLRLADAAEEAEDEVKDEPEMDDETDEAKAKDGSVTSESLYRVKRLSRSDLLRKVIKSMHSMDDDEKGNEDSDELGKDDEDTWVFSNAHKLFQSLTIGIIDELINKSIL